MRTDFNRRLQAVETRIAGQQPPDGSPRRNPLADLLMVLLAYYEGAHQEHESLMTAYSRALRYDRPREFAEKLATNHDDINRRHGEAVGRLLARGQLTHESIADGAAFGAFLDTMVKGVPPELLARVGLSAEGLPDE